MRDTGPKGPLRGAAGEHNVMFACTRANAFVPCANLAQARDVAKVPAIKSGTLPPGSAELALVKHNFLKKAAARERDNGTSIKQQ